MGEVNDLLAYLFWLTVSPLMYEIVWSENRSKGTTSFRLFSGLPGVSLPFPVF